MRVTASALLAVSLMLDVRGAAAADSVQRGEQLARTNCARCHAIQKSGESPHAEAPPFRTLHRRYPVEMLEESLGEGLYTGHPAMPEFQMTPGQVGDFIAFLKSLE